MVRLCRPKRLPQLHALRNRKGSITAMPTPPATTQQRYYPQWLIAWTGLSALAVLNGLSRGLYGDRLGESRAHQVSSATLAAVLLPYVGLVERRWPLPTAGAAATVGAAWVGFTVLFEFGFGHFVAKQPWSTLLADYNLRRGRLWPLVLGVTGTAPMLVRAARRATGHSTQQRHLPLEEGP
jgi:hypothetical protein